jgi:hypothetical protein
MTPRKLVADNFIATAKDFIEIATAPAVVRVVITAIRIENGIPTSLVD